MADVTAQEETRCCPVCHGSGGDEYERGDGMLATGDCDYCEGTGQQPVTNEICPVCGVTTPLRSDAIAHFLSREHNNDPHKHCIEVLKVQLRVALEFLTPGQRAEYEKKRVTINYSWHDDRPSTPTIKVETVKTA